MLNKEIDILTEALRFSLTGYKSQKESMTVIVGMI